jgi:hypothetical protein
MRRRSRALVEWRVTFLVKAANPSSDGWIVSGELGRRPSREGDAVSFVHHEDDRTEESAALRVVEATPNGLRLVTECQLRLRAGDILGRAVGAVPALIPRRWTRRYARLGACS